MEIMHYEVIIRLDGLESRTCLNFLLIFSYIPMHVHTCADHGQKGIKLERTSKWHPRELQVNPRSSLCISMTERTHHGDISGMQIIYSVAIETTDTQSSHKIHLLC